MKKEQNIGRFFNYFIDFSLIFMISLKFIHYFDFIHFWQAFSSYFSIFLGFLNFFNIFQNEESSYDGVLGGFGFLNPMDIQDSEKLINNLIENKLLSTKLALGEVIFKVFH